MNVLIISCSQRKIQSPGEIPAIDRYDGPTYRCLRKFRDTAKFPNNLRIIILSAKYNLIFPETHIEDYDLKMTDARASRMAVAVQCDLVRCLEFYQIAYGGTDEVFINLGKTYKQMLEGFGWGTIPTVEASGGIGQKNKQMKAWLERLRGPKLMGHLSCSVCNDTWFRDLDDMEIQAYIDAHPELEKRILAREITDVDLGEVLCDGCEDYYEDLYQDESMDDETDDLEDEIDRMAELIEIGRI